ncbi:MAG: T9SS type A sorting domain-containing protein [Bacteroidia bacterium]
MKQVLITILFLCAIFHNGKSQTWNAVGSGFTNIIGYPHCIQPLEKLYLSPDYSPCNFAGEQVKGVFHFDGTNADSLGSGVAGYANAVQWYNGKLIVAGEFNYAGGPTQWTIPHTNSIAAWDSVNGWSSITPLGNLDYQVNAMTEYQGNLYVAGDFVSVNNLSVNRIAKWNGTSWSNVGGGVQGSITKIYSMVVYHGQVYIGGDFTVAGPSNISTRYIARWNGSQWSSVGGGMSYTVNDLVVDTVNDVLYACGAFTQAGNTTAYGVARWNDSIWTPVGSGMDTLWATQRLGMFNGELYAGGPCITTTLQGDTLRNFYKYNGTKWISVDGGTNNPVLSMGVFQGNLYVGGAFTQVGNGINASRIACYGTTCPVSVGVSEQEPPVPFRMYPNPNDDVLHIESEEPQQMIFRLSSSDGKLIEEKKFFNKIDHSIKALAPGTYFVEISLVDGSRRHVEKLIVK